MIRQKVRQVSLSRYRYYGGTSRVLRRPRSPIRSFVPLGKTNERWQLDTRFDCRRSCLNYAYTFSLGLIYFRGFSVNHREPNTSIKFFKRKSILAKNDEAWNRIPTFFLMTRPTSRHGANIFTNSIYYWTFSHDIKNLHFAPRLHHFLDSPFSWNKFGLGGFSYNSVGKLENKTNRLLLGLFSSE